MDFEAKDILDVCPYLCLQLNWIGYIGPSISKGLKVKAAHVAPKRSDAMALKVKVRYGRNPHLTFTHVTAVPVAYAAVFLNLNSPSRIIPCHKSSGTYFSCCLVNININNSWTVIHNAVRRYGFVEELEDQENETTFAKVDLSAAPVI